MDGLSMSVSPLRQYPRRAERTSAQWNSAWPIGNDEINIDLDSAYVSNLDGRGVALVLHCGPCFPLSPPFLYSHVFTPTAMQYYGPYTNAKNFMTSSPPSASKS